MGPNVPLEFSESFLRELIIKMIGEAIGNVSAATLNRPRIAAVPSAGRPLKTAPVKPNVALEFEKVFSVEDEE
jgi:hypothetical protein